MGHSVDAYAPFDLAAAERLGEWGIRFRTIGMERAAINPLGDMRCLYTLGKMFREVKPDVVLNYTVKPVIYGSLAASGAGVRRIYSLVTGLGYAFTGDRWRQRCLRAVIVPMYRLALRRNRSIIFQNPDDRAEFESRGIVERTASVYVVNGSGVDLSEFPEMPVPVKPMVFLLVARLLRDKGITEFVSAARRVRRAFPDVRCLLVGPFDPNPAAISPATVATWVREGIVEHTPWVDDVRPFLQACSVYVLPSYREGTPRSTLEALATGRAVITSDAPGCRETVIEGENGFLVPVRDVDGLTAAMERFIRTPALAATMGVASRRLAETRFDVEQVNTAMLDAMGL